MSDADIEDEGPPARILIAHDDYHAKWVGRVRDGRQFFLTTPFVAADAPGTGCEFIALYWWDADGTFLDAHIDNLGPRSMVDEKRAAERFRERAERLGPHQRTTIEVAPFEVEQFGVQFGLIPRPPEDEDGEWRVTVLPGNYMEFYPPWDGEYDT